MSEWYEWVFSGAGIAAISSSVCFAINKSSTRKKQKRDKESTTSPNNEIIQNTLLSKQICTRLNNAITALNKGKTYTKLSIADVSQIMGLNKISDLENILSGKEEPNFNFMQKFSDTFNINYKWILNGENTPFESSEKTPCDPYNLKESLGDINIKEIIFIKCNTETAEFFIATKNEDWFYTIFPNKWRLSSHVGSGGEWQIYSLYKLIKRLKKSQNRSICRGYILPEDKFKLLYNGEIFPGEILANRKHTSHWWDDFTDINHEYPIATNYEQSYGKEFIKAQEIAYFTHQEYGNKIT